MIDAGSLQGQPESLYGLYMCFSLTSCHRLHKFKGEYLRISQERNKDIAIFFDFANIANSDWITLNAS